MNNMKNTVTNRESEPLKQPAPPSENIIIDKNPYIFKTIYGGSVCAKCNGESEIDDYNFENNNILKSVTIPIGITRIGIHAFFACKSLEHVRILNSVTEIGSNAFANCEKLATVEIYAKKDSIAICPDSFPKHTITNFINDI